MGEILRLEGITKYYGKNRVLDDMSFAVKEGEIFSLLGPNGAGKTTLIRIITEGISHKGRILFRGEYIGKHRHRIGYCPQEGLLYEDLKALDNLMFYAMLHRRDNKIAKRLLEEFNLPNKKVKELSGGMRKRLNVAVALVGDPELLVLDEPTVGLDVESRRELWEIILSLKKDGKSVLLTTHYMEEAERLSDRVAIINKGRIIALDTVENLKRMSGIRSAIEVSGIFKEIPEGYTQKDNAVVYYTTDPKGDMIKVISELEKFGDIKEVVVREPTLEDVFLKLTGRRLNE